jgi:hypothetical protein
MIDRTLAITLKLIEKNGGSVSVIKNNRVARINTDAQFNAPVEFYTGPPAKMEINQPVDFTFYSDANKNYNWSVVEGVLPPGINFEKGKLKGTPRSYGVFPIKIQLDNGKKVLSKTFDLLVKNENLAKKADSIIANVYKLNESVLDSCWTTFGNSMYAKFGFL